MGRTRATWAKGAVALAAVLLAAPAGADVVFAAPDDPVFLALYPRMDRATGLSPVAEPAVAVGRAAPRTASREECRYGFRIAGPVTKEWSQGGADYVLAFFFVTSEQAPGVNAGCYEPQPWVCALERGAPVDCARVEQEIVFPDEPAIDTAPFRLSETERAFGLRLRSTITLKTSAETQAALVLFRLHERRLQQVLALQSGTEEDTYGSGECVRTLALRVEKTKTAGMFDWTTRTSSKTGKLPCTLETGTYSWDGARYVKRGKE